MDGVERVLSWLGWNEVDWDLLLLDNSPPLEIFLRGTVMYLVLFGLLRAVLKRETGGIAVTDLLVVVLLADASQNAMAGEYTSIPDGVLLVATIIFWSHALNWLGYRFPRIQRLVHPKPLVLIEDGQPIHRNLKKELLTPDELMSLLRLQGVEEIREVRRAYMEGDGRVSVVTRRDDGVPRQPSQEAGMRS